MDVFIEYSIGIYRNIFLSEITSKQVLKEEWKLATLR